MGYRGNNAMYTNHYTITAELGLSNGVNNQNSEDELTKKKKKRTVL